MSVPVKNSLVLGWGNPGRGDDALGPLCVEALRHRLAAKGMEDVELLEDYQLQVEHVAELLGRERVLLIDAGVEGMAPYSVHHPRAQHDQSYTSHQLTPGALLQVFLDVYDIPPPCVTVLSIKGVSFELGDDLSQAAREHLGLAVAWAARWCLSAADMHSDLGVRPDRQVCDGT